MTPQRRRLLLVALNAELGLHRESVCRLADTLERWSGPTTRASGSLARELAIPIGELRKARDLLPGAESRGRAELARAHELGARVLTRDEPGYPSALGDLDLPPPVLYIQGELRDRRGVAIVGSRQADPYGIAAAEHFASALSAAGVTVISGLAVGIDSAAHRAAVTIGPGSTMGVLGCGIDRDYPRGSLRLRRRMEKRGAVVSEFPIGCSPWPQNFPIRNRIIAALGAACLVVQATRRSGSLITARLALELGRDVWAVPGRIFDPRSRGTNDLIRDGAFPALDPEDLLAWLPNKSADGADPGSASSPSATEAARETDADGSGLAARLLGGMLPGEPVSPDDLASLVDTSVNEVLGALLELEMLGAVRRYPGGKYATKAGASERGG